MKKPLLLLFIAFLAFSSVSASTDYYFFVQFKNKTGTSFSLSHPEEFLSARSIARRASFGVVCDSTDLPVNPSYINQISSLGIKIHSRTKWLNGVTVTTSDSSVMQQVRALPIIKKVQYTGKTGASSGVRSKMKLETEASGYGSAATQTTQIKLDKLHSDGFKGQGMVIGILDGGFYQANTNTGLDSLRLQGRLLGNKDIILPGNNLFNEDKHGANVLTIMAGNIPNQYLGSAPRAAYWLIRTEYVPAEYLFEPDFWVSGIEFADSVGVDVVNSSLGYTIFDDNSMNYTYADMNGKVSRASMAAKLAADKGIIVCNSAGNEGNRSWHYIGAPADADGIFSVGAVTSAGTASTFTSYGPAADGRIKPEICGMGTSTSYIYSNAVTYDNGTSYSSPVIAGALTCLLQKYKSSSSIPFSLNNFRQAVIQSGNLYLNPSSRLGYGIPDMEKASQLLSVTQNLTSELGPDSPAKVYFSGNSLVFSVNSDFKGQSMSYALFDLTGRKLSIGNIAGDGQTLSCDQFPQGIYLVRVTAKNKTADIKIIISK